VRGQLQKKKKKHKSMTGSATEFFVSYERLENHRHAAAHKEETQRDGRRREFFAAKERVDCAQRL
jgi:hypothetical protein